ncbi:hypothetical protein QUB12_32630 [Microcoleus sp. B7-D4]
MGNPRCQGDRALAGYRMNDSLALARHQPAASLANRIASARKLLASAADAELHQLACVVPGNAPS